MMLKWTISTDIINYAESWTLIQIGIQVFKDRYYGMIRIKNTQLTIVIGRKTRRKKYKYKNTQ